MSRTDRLRVEGIPELWTAPYPDLLAPAAQYRPAVLVECVLNYRSLRAGLNYSEDRSYAAWLPERDLAMDWDAAPPGFDDSQISSQPAHLVAYSGGDFQVTADDFRRYQDELVGRLVRNERLRLFFNPVFGLYSSPGESLENFLASVAEAALRRVEPELKALRRRFELQLEQIREAQERKGLKAEGLAAQKLELSNLRIFESENRLASIFSTLAGTVFGTTGLKHQLETGASDVELREDLERVEQEASLSLKSLYDEYLALANEYDIFEIGLQPDNIQVARLALLWVAIPMPGGANG